MADTQTRHTQIKICGVTTAQTYQHCADLGVDWIGFVFFEKSPRHLGYDRAAELADTAAAYAPKRVALTVNADDAMLKNIMTAARPEMIQLHGHETADRAQHIQQTFGVKVMPVITVSSEADLKKAESFRSFCDWVLFDAAMPPGAVLPGGRGEQFDWQILDGFTATYPWMLAGGLNPDNVANAISMVRPDAVDISSGVEIEKGVKDNQLITEFVTSVRG